ncbi:MAG: type I restriction-modification system subunit M [Candidatus Poribacteria bacterium]|nr:type I restriction-modification system subunit M [Candidatus Poribacteria bacterium]
MALKKSQIYASLWQSCDELRGGMDSSQYKDYILTLLFMKYVSDKYADDSFALVDIPDGGGFEDMAKLGGDKYIGEKIDIIIGKFAEANDLKGVIDQACFNDASKLGTGKEMQDRLSKLVAIFDALDFRANRAEGDDLLGDAYEYLMRHFATESGKSKGQFYTPAEVSRIMAKVIGIGPDTRQNHTIYDPACGSGSLLLKAADEAPNEISIYGQEKDIATYALARMNMFLHDNPTAVIWQGNTLSTPHFKNQQNALKTFDFAVANPPFSDKAWNSGFNPAHDEFRRFEYGVPPARNGDYAFLLHFIASLNSRGKGAIILPHGVLFRGNKEADIRRKLIQQGFIRGIIGLPANLFYGTGIPACILVIDKANARARTGIFMINASKGFMKDGNKNRLRAQDIHRIVDVYNKQTEIGGYSRMVPVSEIADPANDYNLNIPRYIDAGEPEDLHDLDAHLNGGIPDIDIDALDTYWTVFPTLRQELFKANGRRGYSDPKVETQQVNAAILNHREFVTFQQRVRTSFNAWRDAHEALLFGIDVGTSPKDIVHTLSEEILLRFADMRLLDPYDVYQRLMNYWDEMMQDDVYLIASDGWGNAAQPRYAVEDKNRKIKEKPDLKHGRKKYKMDLIPPALIVARYFADEQEVLETLGAKQEDAKSALDDYLEEHTGDEGLLSGALNDKGNVTKVSVKEQLKAITPELLTPIDEDDINEERNALERCMSLLETKSKADKSFRAAQDVLNKKVLARYTTLTETEIKTLVVEDKWFSSIGDAIEDEVQRMTQRLTGRVKELEERYAQPLPELDREVEALSTKVAVHLENLGVDWT